MKLRRIIVLILITILVISTSPFCNFENTKVYGSSVIDFVTSESINITDNPGSTELTITPLVIDNYGPALSVDRIELIGNGEWSIVDDYTTDWNNLSVDIKCYGITSNGVDLSKECLNNIGIINTNKSSEVKFDGHIGARSYSVVNERIGTVITSVSLAEAEDEGNTILYQNGTLIINENPSDHDSNVEVYGSVIKRYPDYVPGTTLWNSLETVPWSDENDRSMINTVEFGSDISVDDMSYWFYQCDNLKDIDFANLNLSECTGMSHTFDGDSSIVSINMTGLDTGNVESMDYIFANCSSLTTVLVDDNWSIESVKTGQSVIEGTTSIVGGDGHVYVESATFESLIYDSYDKHGYLTYNGSDKCVISYDTNKSTLQFKSNFCNQVKSGDKFTITGEDRQINILFSGERNRIIGFIDNSSSSSYVQVGKAFQSYGEHMTMYAVYRKV